jgi:acetyltransferase-like isoleucine patch superfamily enzyme
LPFNIQKHEKAIVEIQQWQAAGNVTITADEGAEIIIGHGCVLGHLLIHACKGARVQIGVGVGFNGVVRLLLHEPKTMSIGAGSLIAGGTDILVSDMHSIIDICTDERINNAKDVRIDDRVWIGQNCLVLKGSIIGSDSIIGGGSVVTGMIPSNSLAVGTPARVVRSNVRWQRELL